MSWSLPGKPTRYELMHATCVQEDDVKMPFSCIRLDLDCADICRPTALTKERWRFLY